jgi:transposase
MPEAITREELVDLYHQQGLSMALIAQAKGVSRQRVHQWMVAYDIPRFRYRRVQPFPSPLPPLSRDELAKLLKAKTVRQIAVDYDASTYDVYTWIQTYDLPRPGYGYKRKRSPLREAVVQDGVIFIRVFEDRIAIVDEEDGDLALRNWFIGGQYATSRGDGASIDRMHHVVIERVIGRPLCKGEEVDHRNQDKLDNRRSNLRLATRSDNACKRRTP